jgi:hypothetical protein
MKPSIPRLVIAALRGGAGKTTLSVGVIAALSKRGVRAVPFKKGPDYIDAAWLSFAAGRACHNLDSFLMDRETIRRSSPAMPWKETWPSWKGTGVSTTGWPSGEATARRSSPSSWKHPSS